ncbi:tannase/feruloyl esterase family alpha/beta hydrolase [Micromonospora sp. STR1s_5]|nr:tannase/feruloyl esterase family alpha/beta hydrolase [Micromonospora sp. STR1s_5]
MLRTLLLSAVTGAMALSAMDAKAAQDCAALANMKIENTNLLSSTEVPAAGDLPGHCRVLGFVRPAINFEVRLPLQGWNGKFYMAGCGGFCGTLDSDRPGFTNAMNFGLRRNYAVSTMDSGHWGTSVLDGRWAMNNPVAQMDWGQRAVTETARVSKALLNAYYGTAQQKSYFVGCSTGGRMAAMEAIRYPKDFDGIISGAPALDYTGLVATFFSWVTKANTGSDGKPILTTAKAKLVQDAAYAACDDKDGVKDGIIADPRRCDFKPASLQCKAGNALDCLSAEEVGVVEKWYQGPINSKGQKLFPGGIPVGSEMHWPRWMTGLGNAPALMPLFGRDFVRYMAFEPSAGPSFNVSDYDFDKDPSRTSPLASVYNAGTFDPISGEMKVGDISAFRQGGGKLIMYHGWSDPLVTPQPTVEFYEAIAKRSGGLGATQDFARLFMVPGMDHCGIGTEGPGISDTGIDPLTALEQWVEQGRAPDELVATKTAGPGRQTAWTRPICAYPKVARYKGSGDVNAANSFTCNEP